MVQWIGQCQLGQGDQGCGVVEHGKGQEKEKKPI
jgi:hypothetical protein